MVRYVSPVRTAGSTTRVFPRRDDVQTRERRPLYDEYGSAHPVSIG